MSEEQPGSSLHQAGGARHLVMSPLRLQTTGQDPRRAVGGGGTRATSHHHQSWSITCSKISETRICARCESRNTKSICYQSTHDQSCHTHDQSCDTQEQRSSEDGEHTTQQRERWGQGGNTVASEDAGSVRCLH